MNPAARLPFTRRLNRLESYTCDIHDLGINKTRGKNSSISLNPDEIRGLRKLYNRGIVFRSIKITYYVIIGIKNSEKNCICNPLTLNSPIEVWFRGFTLQTLNSIPSNSNRCDNCLWKVWCLVGTDGIVIWRNTFSKTERQRKNVKLLFRLSILLQIII